MNKEELIKEVKNLKYHNASKRSWIDQELVLGLIDQLDKPQEIEVPEVVNRYIQEAREYNWELQDLLKYIDDEYDEKLSRWFYQDYNQEKLALAWINGYEIKQERYLVKMKGIRENDAYLNYNYQNKKWYFDNRINGDTIKTYHTRETLKQAGFGWVFDCPGIEIKDVSE